MTSKIICDKTNPPIGGLAIAALINIKATKPVEIEWGKETTLIKNDNSKFFCHTNNDVLRTLARESKHLKLYGETPIESTQIDHWLTFSLLLNNDIKSSILYLNKCLAPITYLVSNQLTIADLAVFHEFFLNKKEILKENLPNHVERWYNLISSQSFVVDALKMLPTNFGPEKVIDSKDKNKEKEKSVERKQEGKFVDLPGAEMGKVVVRFPPEASGYLHIGHAKAALLNQYYQQAFQGKLIMRFDDTNPAKENVEFEKVILEDLEMLEIKSDLFTYTSNYFDLMLEYCEQLLKESLAYVDDTPPEQMKTEREQKTESINRSNSVDKNFELWKEMLNGSDRGKKCCVRAKIDMSSPNGCMRDPTIYRCKPEPHPRTGTKYKVYPTYDFACPIVDAIENVTHTLRTMEYHDRDDQFYWFIDALKLRKPYIWEYARLNMTNTVLSKRKLTWFVENQYVDGWDDPRFPTVRGILRRGMTVEGLKQFIIAQGSSKSVVFMEWDKIWAINKKVIDPIAPRYTALEKQNTIVVNVKGAQKGTLQIPLHPKNPDVGMKTVHIGPRILIDYVDAETLVEGENTTFINWGNLMINKINKENNNIKSIDATLNLENKDFKKTLKLTWLCEMEVNEFTPTYCVYFEHIISKGVLGKDEDFKDYIGKDTRTEVPMLGDPELKTLKKGDIIQLQRRGFFKVDTAYAGRSELTGVESSIVLFSIPDGHTKEMPTAGPPKKIADKSQTQKPTKSVDNSSEINDKITKQGEIVRNLKSQKATKTDIDAAVKTLLSLKVEYKTATGTEWKPPATPTTPSKTTALVSTAAASNDLNDKITKQGEIVRDLKAQKAAKADIDAAVKILLSLKVEYKTATGTEWKPPATPTTPSKTTALVSTGASSNDLNDKITQQGEIVRELKAQKAPKADIEAAVKILLSLKVEYKTATGTEWKPTTPVITTAPSVSSGAVSNDLNDKITKQGEIVRNLKAQKATKLDVDAAVKVLLALKGEYKTVTGQDWKPAVTVTTASTTTPILTAAPISVSSDASSVNQEIIKKGDLIRNLKAQKATKQDIDKEVKTLLELKGKYKSLTGEDWKPNTVDSQVQSTPIQPVVVVPTETNSSDDSKKTNEILRNIASQGDKIRLLKTEKADKSIIDGAVKILLSLKTEYKSLTGKDWKPGTLPDTMQSDQSVKSLTSVTTVGNDSKKDELTTKVNEQGNIVRALKTNKAAKDEIDAALSKLLSLKAEYKELTGTDFPVAGRTPAPSKPRTEGGVVQKKEQKQQQQKGKPIEKVQTESKDDSSGVKKQTRLGLEAKKEENLADWYSQVITKGELIEYYDVSGCYILRHWSFAVWKIIKAWFDNEITKMGVKECYFPIFVSKAALEKEKDHIADFAPEVAWVTKSGESDLAEPIAVRPTSETVMYPAYAKWIQSYRDLPIRLNQWNNVVRWEFKHPQPFLRTREFLWQEGHTAFATTKEAEEEVLDILELYAKVYTDLLAIPVVKGRKTEKEKFAGGDYTTTVEAYISASGRAIQGATSHHLGQNFSKMFEIVYEDPETKVKKYVYQNSWGITTRTIGVMVMIHADNQGLVLPPQVAAIQCIIVPCGVTVNMKDDERNELFDNCKELEKQLIKSNIRAEGDFRDNYSPGWKFNHWELKGVPIRIELGPKDLKAKQFVAVRRDTGEKITIPRDNATILIADLLETIHKSMLAKATKDLMEHIKTSKNWTDFCKLLDEKNLILSPFCGDISCEEKIKAESARDDIENMEAGAPSMGAKSLCIPFEQPTSINTTDICIHPACQNKPKFYTLFGRSY